MVLVRQQVVHIQFSLQCLGLESDVSADVKFSSLGPSALFVRAAGTRGGHRQLQMVQRCGRPSCNNRVNLQGETYTEAFRTGGCIRLYNNTTAWTVCATSG